MNTNLENAVQFHREHDISLCLKEGMIDEYILMSATNVLGLDLILTLSFPVINAF